MPNLVARDVSSWKITENNIAYLDKQNNLYLLSINGSKVKVASNVKEFQFAKDVLICLTNDGDLLIVDLPKNSSSK